MPDIPPEDDTHGLDRQVERKHLILSKDLQIKDLHLSKHCRKRSAWNAPPRAEDQRRTQRDVGNAHAHSRIQRRCGVAQPSKDTLCCGISGIQRKFL